MEKVDKTVISPYDTHIKELILLRKKENFNYSQNDFQAEFPRAKSFEFYEEILRIERQEKHDERLRRSYIGAILAFALVVPLCVIFEIMSILLVLGIIPSSKPDTYVAGIVMFFIVGSLYAITGKHAWRRYQDLK